MIMTNKLLPVALIAALVGGSVGALVMHSRNQSSTAAATTERSTVPTDATYVADRQVAADPYMPAAFNTAEEQGAYKVGFADGFRAGATAVRRGRRVPRGPRAGGGGRDGPG